jgi:hypothetical protein
MLAETLMEELQEAEFTRPADTEDHMPGTLARTPPSASVTRTKVAQTVDHRKSWVKKDDAIVHQSHTGASRGKGWPHGARGQRG